MGTPLKVCYVSSEVAPFAKTGGLGDVGAALPAALRDHGTDVRVFLPRYDTIDPARYGLITVDFVQDVAIGLGGHTHSFGLLTGKLPGSDLHLYFVDCPELFARGSIYPEDGDDHRRFAFLSHAALVSCQHMGWGPDIVHGHDWHTGLLPLLLRTCFEWDSLFRGVKTVHTIHNIGYQGVFPARTIDELGLGPWSDLFDREDLRAQRVNFLRTALIHADVVTTVSPTYAREIQTEGFGMGLQQLLRARSGTLLGILNGVDYGVWSPERDAFLPHPYSAADLSGKQRNKVHLLEQLGLPADPRPPLVGIVSRLIRQKGFDLCAEVLPRALATTEMRLAVLGTGETTYESLFHGLQQRFPGQVVFYRGYSDELAHLIEGGSDMFLMPSLYEPCGLNQMFSLRYGTIPIVRRTGGLADTVEPFDPRSGSGTGFVFDHFDAAGLTWGLRAALSTYRRPEAWARLVQNAMSRDFSWERQSQRYLSVYRWLAGKE